jgi:hypothetical protein
MAQTKPTSSGLIKPTIEGFVWPLPKPEPEPKPQQSEAPVKSDRATDLAKYVQSCVKPPPLAACADEIIDVDKVILEREKEFQRSGRGYNAGTSLRGCQIYCILRYYPHDTPQECKASIATFERMAVRKPYLWRTNLRLLLLEKCGLAF